MIEFKTYDRIINGDLRPFSDLFEKGDGLDLMQDEFLYFSFKVNEGRAELNKPNVFFSLFKQGDFIQFDIDEVTLLGKTT